MYNNEKFPLTPIGLWAYTHKRKHGTTHVRQHVRRRYGGNWDRAYQPEFRYIHITQYICNTDGAMGIYFGVIYRLRFMCHNTVVSARTHACMLQIYIYIYIHTNTALGLPVSQDYHKCIQACMHTCLHAYVYACVYTCMRVHMHADLCFLCHHTMLACMPMPQDNTPSVYASRQHFT
jgi:hypothetical protein